MKALIMLLAIGIVGCGNVPIKKAPAKSGSLQGLAETISCHRVEYNYGAHEGKQNRYCDADIVDMLLHKLETDSQAAVSFRDKYYKWKKTHRVDRARRTVREDLRYFIYFSDYLN